MTRNSEISVAVQRALTMSAVAAAGAAASIPAHAQEQTATAQAPLETVTVTGSRIRRTVDEATAAPITVIDSTAITQSGYQTTGDLLTQLPGVAGSAMTTGLNNGGGFGETNIELRGLNAVRTLVLLDGRRIGIVGGPTASGAVDVNQIPVDIIDHVDVLKEGAGAVYGSDAIAGVVNFVTRRNVHDLEISGEYGQTTHGDGPHHAINVLWGGSSEKAEFLVSGSYTKQKAVYAGARDFSKDALYLYSGSSGRFVTAAGSSRVPSGRASLPHSAILPNGNSPFTQYGCSAGGTNNVTLIPGAAGTALTDYQCLHGSYNYQPFNLIMTPQERGALFSTYHYHFNDDLEAYAEVLFNKTHSGFEIAPLPFDATADNVQISATNEFNPFGLSFGGLETTNPNYRTRFVSLGDRLSKSDSDTKLVNVGVKGKLGLGDWQWDANLGYNREDQNAQTFGYVYFPGLQNEVGPSYQISPGVFGCGTDAAHAIPGCTPINFFNLDDPNTIAQLKALNTSYLTNNTFVFKQAALDLNGTIVTLPGGDMMGAIGFQYQSQSADYNVDYLVQAAAPLYISCLISEEACSGNSSGSYDSREVYGELLIPLLKDLPAAKSLNVDIGVRYSDYSLFGSTTKAQFKLEYKPVSDLLLRGTFAQVFRVPTLVDLFAAPLNSSATYADPCYGSTPAQAAGSAGIAATCNGAYQLNGAYAYNGTAQVTALILSNPDLKPETGEVWTAGFVLQVPFVENLSLTADYWNYDIKNIITGLDVNYSSDQCLASADPAYCGLIHRYQTGNNQGQMEVFDEPTVNNGELKTDGVDLDLNYKVSSTPIGGFRFDLNATHINSYESLPGHGAPPVQVAGTFDRQFGNYAKWRGLMQVGWNLGQFDALLQLQYIDSLVIHDPATQTPGLFGQPNPDLHINKLAYLNGTVGYTVKQTNTRLQLGMQNITNRQPPFMYQNNVVNANTDVSTYDLLGRRWFVSFVQKF
ncbi:MAG TPA: TonB-dependent receptor [Steroidobacteraceae bacterium]|nr:TonB-dependent receptor [Steroidobacteraceae bacterium]